MFVGLGRIAVVVLGLQNGNHEEKQSSGSSSSVGLYCSSVRLAYQLSSPSLMNAQSVTRAQAAETLAGSAAGPVSVIMFG